MLYKRLLFTLVASVLLVSCSQNVILDESRDFANHKWMRFEPEEFTAEVKNIDDCFDIYLTATIDTAIFRGNSLPMTLNIYGPTGERRMFRYDLQFKTKKEDQWLGDWDNGYLTVTRCVRQYFFFNNKGDFKFELAQCTNRYELEGVCSTGIRIVKAQLEYPK